MHSRTKNWGGFKINQQPEWPDINAYEDVINEIQKLPSLVFSGETRNLISCLSQIQDKSSFILQVGNCAESFSDCNGPKIHNFLRIFLQMALIINYRSGKDVIKIGRIAGQYAKPRSSNFELCGDIKLPVYRGDIVNGWESNIESRTADPSRMKEAYFRSAATLNLIRAFIQGGYDDIENINDWEHHFFSNEIINYKFYKDFVSEIHGSLGSVKASLNLKNKTEQIYVSHEALLLDYEEAFTRLDTTLEGYYNTSAHFLWVGDRTRQIDSAHVDFLSSIENPIGMKIGPQFDFEEVFKVIEKLNPKNINGKLVLISRMGASNIEERLPELMELIIAKKYNIVWMCDPMHGNTFSHGNFKVRSFDDIVSEVKSFFQICKNYKVHPGGVHLEITDENVTECIGGINGLKLDDLGGNYLSKVDPRLNAAQSLEIAFIVSELLKDSKN